VTVVAAESGYKPGWTLPAAWYTEPEWLHVEDNRIFERSWQYVGWLGNLTTPGSFLTTTVGRMPVVVVHGNDGELRALVNVCRHRGSVVVPEACGSRKTFQCRYHAWTYNLDGTLRKAPRLGDDARSDQGLALERLRLETVGPFAFVCADAEAESLSTLAAEWLPLLEESGLEYDNLVLRESRTYDVKANWKVLAENFLECYHCPVSHHGFSRLIDLDTYAGHVHSDVFWHFRSTARAAAVETNTAGIGDLPRERRDLWNFVVWGSFMANIYPGAGNISTNRLIPLAVDRTLAIYDFYFEPSATDEQVCENIEFIDTVQQEDIALCESVQRGLRSGRLDRGRFVDTEVFLDRFVREVARHMADDDLAAPVLPEALTL
jgi:phenylpropionate dioxygenase-like ring-hydroxylating dioxygenase large terminal subunit